MSLLFSSGKMRVVMPSLLAPIVFSLTPPIADTFPDSVIYPVIAISRMEGLFRARDINEQVMATPAEGPSFPISISGKFKCTSLTSRKLLLKKTEVMYLA